MLSARRDHQSFEHEHMINDIFATSMHGQYATVEAGRTIETGEWSYEGLGNGELTLAATAELPAIGTGYELRLHSAERQLDEIYFRSRNANAPTRSFHAKIAGHVVTLATPEDDGGEIIGNLSVPPETIFDGPSPIWLIHLVMTAPPPKDQPLTTPVVLFDTHTGELEGSFYRVEREGNNIGIRTLDKDGQETGAISLIMAEDGCPMRIARGAAITEIVRLPSV